MIQKNSSSFRKNRLETLKIYQVIPTQLVGLNNYKDEKKKAWIKLIIIERNSTRTEMFITLLALKILSKTSKPQ